MIAIVDYEMGNVRSVANALESLGCRVKITREPPVLEAADQIILPGVGAFGEGMNHLKKLGLVEVLNEQVLRRKKPFLGICLGMQLMAEESSEFGLHKGLGWIKGCVKKLEVGNLRLPHVGWNNLVIKNSNPLLEGMGQDADFYFVHSYHFKPVDGHDMSATCEYGGEFAAVVHRENLFGTQFHPEKSQRAGRRLLEKFCKLK